MKNPKFFRVMIKEKMGAAIVENIQKRLINDNYFPGLYSVQMAKRMS
jgi:hypothetical protein